MQMIGIWCITVWQQLGRPDRLRLIELGPGRGTLMSDLLRGTSVFKPFQQALKVHLVEVRAHQDKLTSALRFSPHWRGKWAMHD